MSDKNRHGHHNVNNTDNQNTKTTYIPPEVRAQYRQQGSQPQQGYYNSQQPYQGQPQQGYYNGQQPYQEQPQQGYYNGQQLYQGQPQQGYYNGQQPYQEQPVQRKRRPESPPPQKKKKKKKRSGAGLFLKRFITTLFIIFLLLFGIYSCTSISLIKKMEYTPTGSRTHTSGALTKSYVTSILLIGTDGRALDEQGRSDTMILVSLNSSTNEVSVTSFMRDCYVEIPGYGWNKLNASYSFGGPELLMDTIEHNFGVRVDDYVSINFISFASIVDAVGGIDVDLSDAEAQEINVILQAEVNQLMGDDTYDDLLSGGGSNIHLNGKQALSYARIRYVGNADFERTERQRRVVELVMDKLKTLNPVTLKNVSDSVLPNVRTNMPTAQLYLLSLRAPLLLGYDRQQLQIPADGTYWEEYNESGSALGVDFDANYSILESEVFAK